MSGASPWTILGLALCYGFLFWLAYVYEWPFILIATLPLALLAESRRIIMSVVAAGLVTWATWLAVYSFFAVYSLFGLIAISAYHGLTVSTVVFATQWLRTRTRAPLALIFPCLWTGGEVWRMMGPIGLPLGLLAPPVGGNLWMIQVSDLFGLYGVSFAIAMLSGLGADLISSPPKKGKPLKQWFASELRVGAVTTASVWLFIASYGAYRLVQSNQTMVPGPVATVVQTDIPTRANVVHGFDPDRMLNELLRLSEEGLSKAPDLVIWPEALSGMPPLNRAWLEQTNTFQLVPPPSAEIELRQRSLRFYQSLTNWVTRHHLPLLLGSLARSKEGSSVPGNWEIRNTARLLLPSQKQRVPEQSQDKVHLFPLEETLPWSATRPFVWLNSKGLIPASLRERQWLTPGRSRDAFKLAASGAQPNQEEWRFAVPICSEIMFPGDCVITPSEGEPEKPIDFIVNISNNGGFQRNRAAIYHSILLPFRAVEGRVGVARSSNAGISGFVRPTGEVYGEILNERGQRWTGKGAPELDLIEKIVRIRNDNADAVATDQALNLKLARMIERVKKLRSDAGITGQSTQTIWVDKRQTVYSRTGDVFGAAMFLSLISASIAALHHRIVSPLLRRFVG